MNKESIKLKIKCRKLRYDHGASAWRALLDHIRYAGKVDIEEIIEDEEYVGAIVRCYEPREWIKDFVIKRIRQRLAFVEILTEGNDNED